MKKFFSITLLIPTIIVLIAGIFLISPKKADALFGIGDISIDPVQIMKDWVLDQLPKTIARHMVVRLQQEIARWAQGGFTDKNKPFAMTSWKQEVKEALQIASSRFVSTYNLTPLCSPFRISLGTMLGINTPTSMNTYETYGACTIQNIVNNVEDFYKNPSITLYGWDTWSALAQPNNNVFGSYLRAQAEKTRLEEEEVAEVEKEVEAGQGIKNETICNLTDQQKCAADCSQYPAITNGMPNPIYVACMSSCEKSSIGVCLQETVKKLGSEIKTSVDKAIGADIDWLISADEITEMINLVFSGLFNKLTHGINGMLTKGSSSTTTISKTASEYAYYKEYKKTQTPQDITKLKGDILTNILKSIQSVSGASYACDKDEQIKGEIFDEVVADIMNEESQHLYTTMEGIDLKPDFIVLDTQTAVDKKYAVYGRTWDDVPFEKYPEKCAGIANKKCIDIKTFLPYELNLNNINSECTTGCLEQVNNYIKECLDTYNQCVYGCDTDACKNGCYTAYTSCRNAAAAKAVANKECSSTTVANACLNGQSLISKTKNRCDECIKKYDESCALMNNKSDKEECLKNACGNYADISSNIEDAQDFYSRCTLSETKYSCDVCMKEYFMPADYCSEIYDFLERSFVKYPALVYEDLWWGPYTKFEDCAVSRSLDGKISTALTCRILPDFKIPLPKGGTKTCAELCEVTPEELKNVVDGEPREADCTGPIKDPAHPDWGGVWESAGYPAGSQFTTYMVNKKTACCAALVGHDEKLYQRCRGISSEATESKGLCEGIGKRGYERRPECYCDEGERFIGETATSWEPFFRCPDPSGFCMGNKTNVNNLTCRKGCSNESFIVPNMKYVDAVLVETNAAPGGSIVTIAQSGCSDPDESTCVLNSSGSCDYLGTVPSDPVPGSGPGGLCKMETYNSGSSSDCCSSEPKDRIVKIGRNSMTCDLSNFVGQKLNISVISDDFSDCKTTFGFCMTCDPSDPGYPNYGYQTNQCDDKIPREYR